MKVKFKKMLSLALAAVMTVSVLAVSSIGANAASLSSEDGFLLDDGKDISHWSYRDQCTSGGDTGVNLWYTDLQSCCTFSSAKNITGVKSIQFDYHTETGDWPARYDLFSRSDPDTVKGIGIALTSAPVNQLPTAGAKVFFGVENNEEKYLDAGTAFSDYGVRLNNDQLFGSPLKEGTNVIDIDWSTAGSKFDKTAVTGIAICVQVGIDGADTWWKDFYAVYGDVPTEENKVTVSAGTVSGNAGSSVVVPVNVAAGSDITSAGGIQATISYDSSILTPAASDSFATPAVSSSKMLCAGNTDTAKVGAGKADFALISTTSLTAGTWINLHFNIKSGAAGNAASAISFDNVLVTDTMGNIYSNVVTAPGKVTVNKALATYNISYNANGGSGAPAAQTKTEGTDITLSSVKPTWAGHTFLGWADSAASTTVKYAAGAKYTANSAATLYAVWKTNTYTVSFNANGGSGAPSAQTKTYGTDLTLSSVKPTWAGHTFLGWTDSATSSTVKYAAGAKYTANSAAILYAVWKSDTYTVSFNANGGSGAPAAQTKTYGADLTLTTAEPVRTGYSFLGWTDNATSTTVKYAAGAKYTANSAATLYAVWKADIYTVSFNANGGSGAPASQTKTYGVDLTLSSVVPTWAGHNFLGWTDSATSTTVKYAAGAKYTANNAAKLYAVWGDVTYIVTFNANGGTCATASTTVAYNGTIATLPTPSYTGYSFDGWFTTQTGGDKITTATTFAANTVVFAHWTQIVPTEEPSVSFDSNIRVAKVSKNGNDVTRVTYSYMGTSKIDYTTWSAFVFYGKKQTAVNGASGYVYMNNPPEGHEIELDTVGWYTVLVTTADKVNHVTYIEVTPNNDPAIYVHGTELKFKNNDTNIASVVYAYVGTSEYNYTTWSAFVLHGKKFTAVNGKGGYVGRTLNCDDKVLTLDTIGWYQTIVTTTDSRKFYSCVEVKAPVETPPEEGAPSVTIKDNVATFHMNEASSISSLTYSYTGDAKSVYTTWNSYAKSGKAFAAINTVSGYRKITGVKDGKTVKLNNAGWYTFVIKYDGGKTACYYIRIDEQ